MRLQNGMPDHRTLHTAEDAVEGQEKWVSQTWISWGLDEDSKPIGGVVSPSAVMSEPVIGAAKKGKKKKKGSKGFGVPKGFGAKPNNKGGFGG